MKICVIPARGGSKRLPHKNIKEFCGKPIIAWSIEAAINAGCFERVIVSTDDNQIAEIARNFGADVPFKRSEKLADDYVGTIPVIRNALLWCNIHNIHPKFICCAYATAPFIRSDDILKGLQLLISEDCDYAFSATSFPFPIQRAFRITDNNRAQMFQPEHFDTRSQDLEEAYHDAAQFYWGTAAAWLDERAFFATNSVPVILPRHRVQDMDTLEDWTRAELMFKANLQSGLESCE